MYSFEGMNILVVGGSSGMSLTTAQLVHHLGATVTIASRNKARLEHAQPLVGERCRNAVADIPCTSEVATCSSGGQSIRNAHLQTCRPTNHDGGGALAISPHLPPPPAKRTSPPPKKWRARSTAASKKQQGDKRSQNRFGLPWCIGTLFQHLRRAGTDYHAGHRPELAARSGERHLPVRDQPHRSRTGTDSRRAGDGQGVQERPGLGVVDPLSAAARRLHQRRSAARRPSQLPGSAGSAGTLSAVEQRLFRGNDRQCSTSCEACASILSRKFTES